MAVSKPSWLRSWLNKLNWDIFTWKVYIGDAIEDAIDWALEWINWGINEATKAYNKAWDAYFYAVDVYKDLRSQIYQDTQDLWDRGFAWWSELGEWWNSKKEWVKDRIQVARDTLEDLYNSLSRSLNSLATAWDSFKRDTLPGLVDFTWWTSFWGANIPHISDWWAAKRQEIDDFVGATTKPIRDELNKYLDTLSSAKQLFSDPLAWPDHFARWVLNWIESIIARIW